MQQIFIDCVLVGSSGFVAMIVVATILQSMKKGGAVIVGKNLLRAVTRNGFAKLGFVIFRMF